VQDEKVTGKRLGKTARHPHRTIRQQTHTKSKEGKEPYKPKANTKFPKPRAKKATKAKKPPAKGDISEWKLELRTPKKGRSKDDPDHPDIDPKPDW
jgi:hypothetical protein